jgi:hypothetical protein
MTVEQLIKELKKYPKDANVFTILDWEKVDDDGKLTECKEVDDITSQTWYDDTGFGRDYVEVIIC